MKQSEVLSQHISNQVMEETARQKRKKSEVKPHTFSFKGSESMLSVLLYDVNFKSFACHKFGKDRCCCLTTLKCFTSRPLEIWYGFWLRCYEGWSELYFVVMEICFIFMFTDPKPVVPLLVPDRFVYVTSFAQAYSTTVNNFSKFLERITHVRLRDHFGHTKLQKRGQTQSKTHYASLVQMHCCWRGLCW